MLIAQEKYLKFTGYETDALNLVNDIRHVFDTAQMDMPKVINDFVLNIEVDLQNAGILDEDFNEATNTQLKEGTAFLLVRKPATGFVWSVPAEPIAP
jgi:hypothetical protein